MFKKILIGGLVAVVVVAAAFSIYNTTLAAQGGPAAQVEAPGIVQEAVPAAAQGVGQGYGQGNVQGSAQGSTQDYSTALAQVSGAAAGQGNAQGNAQGAQTHGNRSYAGDQSGVPNPQPQNGLTEWVSYAGTVSGYAAPAFSLLTDDGQSIPAEVGNLSYANELGLVLQDGERVSVIGFWDAGGGLALKSLTIEASGQTFNFRDEYGRPLWSGGRGQGGQSQP